MHHICVELTTQYISSWFIIHKHPTLLGGTSWLVSFTFIRRRLHFMEGPAWAGGLLTGPVEVWACSGWSLVVAVDVRAPES
jgi:hypothetical protein